ncbi:DUF4129 domain-containing protein [Chloroflexota bacterium]
MKIFTFALSTVLLLAMLSPCFSSLAQPSHIPHQNPATAQSSLELVSLLLFYTEVFDRASLSQYQDAQSMLGELEHADIPDEIRNIFNRYNTLSNRLLTGLNNIEARLDEASILFSQHQISYARQKLNEAEAAIRDTQVLLADIETASNTLGTELGVFAAAASSQTKGAYNRLGASLDRLEQLIAALNQLHEEIADNPQRVITTNFYYQTLLEIATPKSAQPGLPITISGEVSSTGSAVDRTIEVLLDNTLLATKTVTGQFQLQLTPPPQTATGGHTLTVVATPHRRYAGASKSLPLNISRVPIVITEIRVPPLSVIPKPIQISGKVYGGSGPIQDARVSLTFKGSAVIAKTAADGSFNTNIKAPFDLSLLGHQELTMTIEPAEPWYASLQMKRWILNINPANMGLIIFAFASLGLLVLKRARTTPGRAQREIIITEAGCQQPPMVTATPRPEPGFTSIKSRIFSAYGNSLRAVEKIIGMPMAPHTTLREFISAATVLLPGAIKPFTELTMLTEQALYSTQKLDENTAARAELLASTIKEELHSRVA